MNNMNYSEKVIYEVLFDEVEKQPYKSDFLEILDAWLIRFGYKKEAQFFDKILYVCKKEPVFPFGEGVDIFVIGKTLDYNLIGRKYIHWFKEEGLELSDDYDILFNSTLFSR